MITPDYVRTLARYNSWQNASLVAAADTLAPEALVADRGAFFGSVLRTFSHLLWGDAMWMSRFDGGTAPDCGIKGSPGFETDWTRFRDRRAAMDERIEAWAGALATTDGTLRWHSGALGREVERTRAICFVHFFNHQTHHRGQIHAMLTAAGARPEDTDLFILPGAG